MEQLSSRWTDFHETWHLRIFRKSVEKIKVSLKLDKNKGYFTWRPILIFLSNLARFFLECEMFQIKVVEKIKTNFVFSNLILKSYRLWENVNEKKHCTAVQATDGNRAHSHCMLDNYGYKYTHSGCITLIASPLQQWLHERAAMLRHMYTACLV
jgi:hypothetical protein